jgi:hypothetical protein
VTAPPPGGPGWQSPSPGAERHDDRPAWLQQPAPGPEVRGWSPTQPPSDPPPGRRVGRLMGALVLLVVVGLAVGGLVFATRREQPATTAGAATAGAPTTQAPAATPTTRAPAATPAGPGVRAVQRDVAELRGLEFRRRVPVTVESPDKLAKRLLGVLADETDEDELRRQGRAMELLGELPAGTDLPRLLNRVQAESVLGFYLPGRPPKGGLYVRSSRGLDPYAKIILAHELTHAVTDQRFDLTKADRLAAATAREDELAAYSGLVEGDATLTMQRYLAERLTPAEQADAGLVASTQRTPERDAAPAVIRQSLLFPYEQGLRFVRALYAQGGWDAVNDAYRDPPTSTEQLLHPERYLGDRDQPQQVELADLSGRLGGGWRPAAELSFGELDARLLLQGELAVTTAEAAAEGWDGGRLRTFQRGTGTALALRTVWDSGAEATQFCGAMRGWATGRFGPGSGAAGSARFSGDGQRAALVCRGSRVAWLSAPDRPTLDRLVRGLGGP